MTGVLKSFEARRPIIRGFIVKWRRWRRCRVAIKVAGGGREGKVGGRGFVRREKRQQKTLELNPAHFVRLAVAEVGKSVLGCVGKKHEEH
jgi:hypothetical protein